MLGVQSMNEAPCHNCSMKGESFRVADAIDIGINIKFKHTWHKNITTGHMSAEFWLKSGLD